MAAYYFGGGPGWQAGGSLPGTDRRPVVTYTLLAINVVVWLAMGLAGGSEDPNVLLDFGAMFGPLIASGEYWRLFTAMFLHVGILHLAFNGFGLFIFGRSHYSAVYTLGSEPRPLAATAFDPTSMEVAAQFGSLIVNTGTYEVDGSTVKMRPLVAKSPEFIGGSATMQFQLDGDVLTLTVSAIVAADGSTPPEGGGGDVMTLRRVE